MSVTKAELVRINEGLQTMIRALLAENKTFRADRDRLNTLLITSTQHVEVLNARYLRLADYMKRLHEWLSEKEK